MNVNRVIPKKDIEYFERQKRERLKEYKKIIDEELVFSEIILKADEIEIIRRK